MLATFGRRSISSTSGATPCRARATGRITLVELSRTPGKSSLRKAQQTKDRHVNRHRAVQLSGTAPHAAASYADSEQRHAVLHDFCMVIPYSCVIAAAGIVSVVLGNGWKGLLVAAAGICELYLTLQSLKRWRAGSGHRLFTAASAGIAGWLCTQFRGSVRDGTAVWPNRLLLWLSAAAVLFLLYNVLAGGNPPKEDEAVTVADSTVPQKSF